MTKIVTVQQMKALESQADASGLSYAQMMEKAGAAVAQEILRRWKSPQGRRAVILAGPGNNGGDGLVAGRHLVEAGMQVGVYVVRDRPREDPHLTTLMDRGVFLARAEDDQRHRVLANLVGACDVLVDAVLGTGFRLPLKPEVAATLAATQAALEARPFLPLRVAVDCPSGVDCDTGETAPEALAADVTLTLGAAKPGLLRPPGSDRAGSVTVADIGIGDFIHAMRGVDVELIAAEDVRGWLPARPRDAHKGTFGTALIVAGSVNYPGSALLAGRGAYRVGTGLVTLAVPGAIQSALVAGLPEATWIVLPEEVGVIDKGAVEVVRAHLGRATALLIGPGLGREAATQVFVERMLTGPESATRPAIGFVHEPESPAMDSRELPPMVIDADGLRLLAGLSDWAKRIPSGTVLTPHPGEMSALTGDSASAIQADRMASARGWAAGWGHVVVLKGAHTVVAEPGGRTAVLPFATPALARAGTGDVLAGAIVGLLAQGLGAFEAATLGAYLHGRAGELAAERRGGEDSVLAGEVAESLSAAIAELRSGPPG